MNNYVEVQKNTTSLYYAERLLKTYERLFERLNLAFTGNLLDIGCGSGDFVYACNLRKNIKAYGIDYPEVDLEVEPITRYKTNFFDVITINAVIEHFTKPDNLMKEIYRHLKVNGVLCLTTPNWKYSKEIFYNDPTHQHPYTKESIEFLLKMYDFELIHISPHLIMKPIFYYKLPFLWDLSNLLWSKSIMAIAIKKDKKDDKMKSIVDLSKEFIEVADNRTDMINIYDDAKVKIMLGDYFEKE